MSAKYAFCTYYLFTLAACQMIIPNLATSLTLNECLQRRSTTPALRVSDGTQNGHFLYEAEEGITWCEAYHACEMNGLRLAVAVTEESQTSWRDVIPQMKAELLWVGGRRKDFGSDWTWLDEKLSDCQEKCADNINEGMFGRLLIFYNQWRVENKPYNFSDYSLCTSADTTQSQTTQTWLEAMNSCVREGGRLATLDEALTWHRRGILNHFHMWLGLVYKPWLWITSEKPGTVSFKPMMFSSWPTTNNDAPFMTLPDVCLSIDTSEGYKWTASPCDTQLKYFLCEDTYFEETNKSDKYIPSSIQETTGSVTDFEETTFTSMDKVSDMNPLYVIVFVAVIVVVLVIVLGTGLYTSKMTRRVLTSLSERHTCDVHECLPQTLGQMDAIINQDPTTETDYGLIEESHIISNKPNFRPRPPARDPTYNQAFENTGTNPYDDVEPVQKCGSPLVGDETPSGSASGHDSDPTSPDSEYPITGHSDVIPHGYLKLVAVDYENAASTMIKEN